jgi:regulator of sigma E protease
MQILAGVILLGVLIAFHELGHFLFAKALGVRVLVFSIGFGPKIFSYTHNGTEYRLSIIPLGGYIRMFGESLEEELSLEEKKQSFMHQKIWRKSLIAFAGPLFNFILPVILLFFLLLGKEEVLAPRIGNMALDGVAAKAGLQVGDLVTSVNGEKVSSFNELAEIISKNPEIDLKFGIARMKSSKLENIDIVVKPESKDSSNILEKGQKLGRVGIMPAVELPIVLVKDDSLWSKAGLKSFDEIKKIDSQEIKNSQDLINALKNVESGSLVEIERPNGETKEKLSIKAPAFSLAFNEQKTDLKAEQELWQKNGISLANGVILEVTLGSQAASLNLLPKDRIVTIDGEKFLSSLQIHQALSDTKPHTIEVLKADGTILKQELTLEKGMLEKVDLNTDVLNLFGVKLAEVFSPGETIERYVGPMEALKRASVQTLSIVTMTAKSLWLLVKREVPASQIGGPIMLFDVAQQAAQKGLAFYISIMCLLSVNLGLLNLLPIPALDGGHLLLFSIEAVQRKPLTAKTRAIATQLGVALLLTLMAFAVFNDLSRIFG